MEKVSTFAKEDHTIWHMLYEKQYENIKPFAYPTFLQNLAKFNLPNDRIPELSDISKKLSSATGWRVLPAKGILNFEEFFTLLEKRIFPVAMFIRPKDQLELSKDPDIFHEIFGHCTMLLSEEYADFMQKYAKFVLKMPIVYLPLFARLLWFTVETGLINSENGLKIYGSSILSSYTETLYAIKSDTATRKPFNLVNMFREPYRADILQATYYVIDDMQQVYSMIDDKEKICDSLAMAHKLGEFNPIFEDSENIYTNINQLIQVSV